MNQEDLVTLFQKNKGALIKLMQSKDGQRMVQLMQQQGGSGQLQRAAASAAKGNPSELADMVKNIMTTSEGAALAARIQQSVEKK